MKNRFPKIAQINTRLVDKQYNDVVSIENTMVFKSSDREYYLNIVKSRITLLGEIINEKYGNDLVKLETKLRDMYTYYNARCEYIEYPYIENGPEKKPWYKLWMKTKPSFSMSDILDEHDVHMDYRGPTDNYISFGGRYSMAIPDPNSYRYRHNPRGAIPYMGYHAMPMHVFHGPDNTKIYGVSNADIKLMSNIKEYYTVVLTNIGNLDSRYRSSSELHEKNELQELSGRLQCKTISPEFNRYLIKRFK